MPLLTLRSVRRTVMDRAVLDGVDLTLDEGDRIGLLGANGSGKSTIMRIAAGLEQPDDGDRVVGRGVVVGHLAQEPVVDPRLSVRDAVRQGFEGREGVLEELSTVHGRLEGTCHDPAELTALLARSARLEDELEALGGYDPEHRVEAMIADLGLTDPDASCRSLSGGERRRIALARLLLGSPDLLLLDEPTNHLDVVTIAWLEEWLAAQKTTLLLVTHDRYVLDRVCNRIVEIDRGKLVAYEGGYADYLQQRAERLAREQHTEDARQNLLRRETDWMRRGPAARSTKAKARIQRYEELVDAAPDAAAAELAFTIPPGPRLGTRVVRLSGVSFAFTDRTLLNALDLELHAGDRLAVIGPNGAGKTTFLRLAMQQLQPDAGEVHIGETVSFAAIDQNRTELDDTASVVREVAGDGVSVRVGDQLQRIESFLDKFLFPGPAKHTLVKDLSGGERNRVLLAKLLLQGGNVLVLDEPTNDLDLMTLRALEEALVAFPGSVIVVSHDRSFVDRVATHVLYLDGNGTQRVDTGSASAVLQRVADQGNERKSVAAAASGTSTGTSGGKRADKSAAAPSVPPKAQSAPPARLSNWERTELDELPGKVEQAEVELARLEERLADAALYTGDADERQRVTTAHEQVIATIAGLYARWEELESRSE